ncbi:hypothetical protein AAFN75_06245 [Algibacter sp. AS12]|uniref:lipopolysaccharide biosynthesis protein n=1 Tax=Algibacter sp. AS12 TaxID=3135773 RepID=UPI00398B87FC
MKPLAIIKKYGFFAAIFTIAKATVYFVPLLLADVLTEYDFGVLEYALAGLGFVLNSLISLGVPGAFPYFILRKKDFSIKNGFILHPIWLLFLFVCNQFAFYFFNIKIEFYLAFNVSYIIANQVFYSVQLKSYEKSTKAVIVDSGIYLVLLLVLLLGKTNIVSINTTLISIFIVGYSLIYVFLALYKYYKADKINKFDNYKRILKFSKNLMLSTFLIFLITVSGRILVEYFFSFEEVGLYAFYFRLSAIVVMIHQVVNIAFFKKMYTFEANILDKYYYLFFMFIFTLSVVIYFVTPYVVGYFSNFFTETYIDNKGMYFLLSVQMVVWIASALNSNIIDRENLTYKNNPKFLVLIALAMGVFYFLKDSMTLSLLVFIHFTVIFVACLIQYFSLSMKQIYFSKSIITLSLIYILSTSYYFMYL